MTEWEGAVLFPRTSGHIRTVGFTIVWPESVIFRSMMTYHSPRNGQSWQV